MAQWAWVVLSLYQTAVTVAGRIRRVATPLPSGERPRVGIVVCARNEEAVVDRIVTDLLTQTYPRELREVVVVAHNCTDATARVAIQAGARVVELNGTGPGKGYAILAGVEALGDGCDLVGVFDADSRAPADLLETVVAASAGEICLQVETVPREHGGWLADGYGLGRTARNVMWWRPREAIGLGATVNGTGFFARPGVLAELVAERRTVTEDLELTARLYARGHRVAYLSATNINVDEPHSLVPSLHQRLRWVRGHLGVIRYCWPGLALRALRGDPRALDIALYILVPTRILTRLAVSGTFVVSLLRARFAPPLPLVALAMAGEWLLPLLVALRERLVPLSPRGVTIAVRHALLSMLWFPIGLWALVTAGSRAWHEMPRAGEAPREP